MNEELETIKESAKAAQEIAKTTGQVIDAAQKLSKFVTKFIKGPLEQGMGIVEDKFKYMRWERQLRLMKRAEHFMKEVGMQTPTRAVQMKFAIPLFQAASLEDNDDIQDLFAKLLVNAANSDSGLEIKRTYIDILERISPLEAQILDKIYSLPFTETQHKGVLTADLPGHVDIRHDDPEQKYKQPNKEVELALANLARLGCISASMSVAGGELLHTVYPTLFGKSFIEACTLTI